MAFYYSEPSHTFSEYLLIPGYTAEDCVPANVSLRTPLTRFRKGEEPAISLNIPMVSAIMQSVSDDKLAIALAKEGGLSFIYGAQSIESEAAMVARVKNHKAGFVVSASNLTPDSTLADVLALKAKNGYSTVAITDDGTANGRLLGIVSSRDYRVSRMDGSQKVKVLLAQALFGNPDILLLDEPTNNLDNRSVAWLEDFLMNNAKAVMVISHDKAFVDHITTRTIEIARGRIYDYKVNYSHYLELRRERREQQQAAYDNQQKMIAETREFIERFKGTYSKTNQVQSRVRMLEKLELIEVDEEDRSALNLRFPPAPRSGSYPVITSELGKAYGDHRVFSDVSITIGRGDKVAFVGRNGEGKSTMVKAIMGQIDFEGEIRIGHNVRIGYFAQNEASGLDESITVFKTVDDIAVGDIRTRIRDILGAFMFGKEASEKLVKVLSGGERTRLAMIKLLLEPVNLLILDEPTNHLDLKTKEILKEALMAFDGTLIVVSHDRDFLDGLTSKIYEFSHGRVTEHLDGVYGFLRKKKIENISEIERRKA